MVGSYRQTRTACNMNAVTAPMQQLFERSRQWNCSLTDVRFARTMDDNDPLRGFRQQFHYPKLRGLPSSLGSFCTSYHLDTMQ